MPEWTDERSIHGKHNKFDSFISLLCMILFLSIPVYFSLSNFNYIHLFYSEFGDIYDEDHFITTLKGFVEVVQELPEVVMERYDYNITNIPNIRIEAWAPVSYYLEEVYPVLRKQGYILNHGFFTYFITSSCSQLNGYCGILILP